MNIVCATAVGWKSSSSGGYISGYGIGRTMSAIGVARARNGATARSPASTVAGVDEHRQDDQLAVMLLGHERHRRRGHHVGDRRQLVRRGLRLGDEGGDHVRRRRQHEHPADDRADRVQAELEPGGDAEVAAAAADRPEQVRMGLGDRRGAAARRR